MKQLGERNWILLRYAAKTLGTWDPEKVLGLVEEEFYITESEEIEKFLSWLHTTGRTMGNANYEEVFQEYKRGLT